MGLEESTWEVHFFLPPLACKETLFQGQSTKTQLRWLGITETQRITRETARAPATISSVPSFSNGTLSFVCFHPVLAEVGWGCWQGASAHLGREVWQLGEGKAWLRQGISIHEHSQQTGQVLRGRSQPCAHMLYLACCIQVRWN